jgi:hypothetical protein
VSAKPRDNFTQIPNLIDELSLSPLAIALYFHYARWTGSRRRMPGVRALQSKYRVTNRAIAKAKGELEKHRLIVIDRRASKGLPDHVYVPEIWERNSKHFERVKPLPDAIQQQVNIPDAIEQQVTPLPDAIEHQHLMHQSTSLKDLDLNTENGNIRDTNKIEKELDQKKQQALELIGNFINKGKTI